jgi:predicted ATPase
VLTRIEIDGFKTFRDFCLDVPPFLVLVGKNAAGKSNLFDALQFLRRLADGSVLEAMHQTRGEVAELFHRYSDGTQMSRMSFSAEVLLDPSVTDAFGDTVSVTHSRLRYEVTLELRRFGKGQRPFVAQECVRLVRRDGDRWIKGFDAKVRRNLAVYSSRSTDLLETGEDEPGRRVFRLNQDGRQGRARVLPAHEATATVLSSLTTAEFPLLYALRREFLSWRLLHLDPTALRTPSSFDDPDMLAPNGAHLANVLRRLVEETATEDRLEGSLNDLAADLASIIPGVLDVRVDEDEARRQRHLVVETRDEAPFSARVASDGTLRAIALLAALYDPRGAGLICFEEPENGIFPQRLARFVDHLRGLVDRSIEARVTDPNARLTQLLMSSHSPRILRALGDGVGDSPRRNAVFVDTVTKVEPGAPRSRITRVRSIAGDSRQLELPVEKFVSPAEIDEFEVVEALDR